MKIKMGMTAVATAAVAVGLMATSAFADGMPVKRGYEGAGSTKDGDYAPARPMWMGWYVGGNIGGAWVGGNDISGDVPASSNMNGSARALEAAIDNGSTGRETSILGGVQAGYNYQLGNIVLGVEGDYNFVDADATRDTGLIVVNGVTGQTVDRIKTDRITTFRARIGYAFDRTLVYFTGGGAAVHQDFEHTQSWSFSDGCPLASSGLQVCHTGRSSTWRVSAVIGGGVEYALTQNWSIKGEYLHIFDGGSTTFTSQNAGFAGQPVNHTSSRGDIDIARLGVNFRF